jgi:hypothetical protein
MSGIGGARLLTQEVDKKIGAATNNQISQAVNNMSLAAKNLIPSTPKEKPQDGTDNIH